MTVGRSIIAFDVPFYCRGMKLQEEYGRLAEEYARLLKRFFGRRLISLCFFGQVVKGTATPESDIDVLTIAEEMPNETGLS